MVLREELRRRRPHVLPRELWAAARHEAPPCADIDSRKLYDLGPLLPHPLLRRAALEDAPVEVDAPLSVMDRLQVINHYAATEVGKAWAPGLSSAAGIIQEAIPERAPCHASLRARGGLP